MAGTRSDVKAFNVNQGDSAAVVGPARSRIRQIVVFGNAAGALTITDNGILAENGAYLSAFTGSGNKLTIFLS